VRQRTRSHDDFGVSIAWVTSAWKPKRIFEVSGQMDSTGRS